VRAEKKVANKDEKKRKNMIEAEFLEMETK